MAGDSDEQVLSAFFETVTPTIEDLVTRALQSGQRIGGIALVLEGKFDGQVAAACLARRAVDAHLRRVQGVDDAARGMIVRAVDAAPATEVPAVLLVHAEGFISVGIRRLPGRLAWVN
jgi:hypothetical protein